MAEKTINGTDLLLTIDGVAIGCATTNSFSVETEMIDAACKESGSFYDASPGMHTATLSTEGLVKIDTPADPTKMRAWDMLNLQMAKTLIDFSFGTAASGENSVTGKAYITSFEMNAGDKENATYSVEMQVVGEFTIEVNP